MNQDHTEDWRQRAACRGIVAKEGNFDTFFPKGDEFVTRNSPAKTTRTAAVMCAGCPVKHECHDYAMYHNIPYGTWGGKNRSERSTGRKHRVQARKEFEQELDGIVADVAAGIPA